MKFRANTWLLIIATLLLSLQLQAQDDTKIPEGAEADPETVEKDGDIDDLQRDLQRKQGPALVVPKAKALVKGTMSNENQVVQSTLSSEDFVALQKIYLRKSGRLGITAGLIIDPSNPFFYSGGFAGALSYNFTEKYGVELFGFNLSATQNDDLKSLERRYNLTGKNYVYPTSMTGLRLLYNPWYGKVALSNKRVIPFDLLFTGGAGSVRTSSGTYVPGAEIGFGQLVSLGRSLGFRWDIMYITYNDEFLGMQDTYLLNVTWTTYYPREVTR